MMTVNEMIRQLGAQRDHGRGEWPVKMLVVRSTSEWEPGFIAGFPEDQGDMVMVMCLPTSKKRSTKS